MVIVLFLLLVFLEPFPSSVPTTIVIVVVANFPGMSRLV